MVVVTVLMVVVMVVAVLVVMAGTVVEIVAAVGVVVEIVAAVGVVVVICSVVVGATSQFAPVWPLTQLHAHSPVTPVAEPE